MMSRAFKQKVCVPFDGGELRVLQPENVHAGYIAGLNDPEINRFLVNVRRNVQTKESVLQFVQKNLDDPFAILLGIWETGSGKHSGTIRIYNVEDTHSTAHIGICIFERASWGKHLGSRALKTATQWALTELHLRWIEAGIYADNVASQHAFDAAGYDWICDYPDKYLYESRPAVVRIYAARNTKFIAQQRQ